MSDLHDADDDRDLFARLRAADPGTHLTDADPTRVGRLLEDVMSQTSTEPGTETGTETRTRNLLTWLVAAAAVVLIAVAGSLMFLGDDRVEPGPTAQATTVTELSLAGDGAGRCMVPNPDVLGKAAYAVDAEVVAVEGGTATLEPTRWYAGVETDQVEVAAGSADLAALIGSPQFEVGQRHLVAANADGRVMVCGFSGLHTQQLADLYAEAFGS